MIINTAAAERLSGFPADLLHGNDRLSLEQWLRLLFFMFLSNIIWNLLFGFLGAGSAGGKRWPGAAASARRSRRCCCITCPHTLGAELSRWHVLAAVLYGATLAGYVPLSALMPSLAPKNKGAAMSLLNLGAGASNWVGPAIVYLFKPALGVGGVMWIYAAVFGQRRADAVAHAAR